jgi:hypothetical protein
MAALVVAAVATAGLEICVLGSADIEVLTQDVTNFDVVASVGADGSDLEGQEAKGDKAGELHGAGWMDFRKSVVRTIGECDTRRCL